MSFHDSMNACSYFRFHHSGMHTQRTLAFFSCSPLLFLYFSRQSLFSSITTSFSLTPLIYRGSVHSPGSKSFAKPGESKDHSCSTHGHPDVDHSGPGHGCSLLQVVSSLAQSKLQRDNFPGKSGQHHFDPKVISMRNEWHS